MDGNKMEGNKTGNQNLGFLREAPFNLRATCTGPSKVFPEYPDKIPGAFIEPTGPPQKPHQNLMYSWCTMGPWTESWSMFRTDLAWTRVPESEAGLNKVCGCVLDDLSRSTHASLHPRNGWLFVTSKWQHATNFANHRSWAFRWWLLWTQACHYVSNFADFAFRAC